MEYAIIISIIIISVPPVHDLKPSNHVYYCSPAPSSPFSLRWYRQQALYAEPDQVSLPISSAAPVVSIS